MDSSPDLTWKNIKITLGRAFRRRCPVCGRGLLFRRYWTMNALCPICGVRYEREQGEFIMAMYINLLLTEAIFISGYFISQALWEPRAWLQFAVWGTFNLAFPIFFYPYSKALWTGFLYLSGQLYRDSPTLEGGGGSIDHGA